MSHILLICLFVFDVTTDIDQSQLQTGPAEGAVGRDTAWKDLTYIFHLCVTANLRSLLLNRLWDRVLTHGNVLRGTHSWDLQPEGDGLM